MTEVSSTDPIDLATEIVAAYVARNSVPMADLPALIKSVHGALVRLGEGHAADEQTAAAPQQPAVPIRKSVMHDCVVCLEDGKKFKSLKRHLSAEHGMTPQDYRAKWNLPKDYPMVAPAYAAARSTLAKTLGLGRNAPAAEPVPQEQQQPQPAPEPVAERPTRRRKAAPEA